MKKLFPLLSIVVLLFSCNKDNVDTTNATEVHVRLKNVTGSILENVHIANTGYGNIPSNKTTGYLVITTPIYSGFCVYTDNGMEKFAGYGVCGSPMPPAFEPGYYTFKAEPGEPGYNTITVTKQ